jgi:hypothetical protein
MPHMQARVDHLEPVTRRGSNDSGQVSTSAWEKASAQGRTLEGNPAVQFAAGRSVVLPLLISSSAP